MKGLIGICVPLLILVTFLMSPVGVLADDPPDLVMVATIDGDKVVIGVTANGDPVIFSIDGVGLDEALGKAASHARGGGDEWTYQQVRINKKDIAIIWQVVGNDIFHDLADAQQERIIIASALERNIQASNMQAVQQGKLAGKVANQGKWIVYLGEVDALNTAQDKARYGITSSEISRLKQEVRATQMELVRTQNNFAMASIGMGIVVIVLLVTVLRLKRKVM